MRSHAVAGITFAVVFVASALGAGCKGRFRLAPDARFAQQIAMAQTFACARMKDGSARCWGANEAGELGDGTHEVRSESTLVKTPRVAAVAAGEGHACALGTDGTVVCWGAGETGVVVATHASVIAVGARHACAIVDGGAVHCWGADDAGQVAGASGVRGAVAIAAGGDGSCVIDADHRVA